MSIKGESNPAPNRPPGDTGSATIAETAAALAEGTMPPRKTAARSALPPEIGGREGPEPTRYGDWEKNGRCIDF